MSNDNLLRQFNTFITQLEGGALNEELTEKIQECIKEISDACCDRGGKHKASVTLKIDFSMDQKDQLVEIECDLKTKIPQTPRGRGGIFFTDSQGNLTRENPKQRSFDDELERQREYKEKNG